MKIYGVMGKKIGSTTSIPPFIVLKNRQTPGTKPFYRLVFRECLPPISGPPGIVVVALPPSISSR